MLNPPLTPQKQGTHIKSWLFLKSLHSNCFLIEHVTSIALCAVISRAGFYARQ